MSALELLAITWILVGLGFGLGWIVRARLDYSRDLDDITRNRKDKT